MLTSLNALAMARDNETGAHIVRTQEYVRCLANRIKDQGNYVDELSDDAIERMHKAAPLHDLGKVGIPDGILYIDFKFKTYLLCKCPIKKFLNEWTSIPNIDVIQ